MKHLLLTTIAAVVLVATTAFADPIHDAANEGDLAGVQAELDKGADVNAKEVGDKWTPLHNAALDGHREIAELLIANGADVNAKDKWGSAPLHFAAGNGHTQTAELLIANGADMNVKDKWGSTPLHFAAVHGHAQTAELLIANGADVNAKDTLGRTPLNFAAQFGRKEVAELLRKHGGKTSAELALIPRLEYGKNQWPFDFSFTAKKGKTYVVEVTQDFKQWGELEAIKGTGKRVKFIDPRQPLVQFKRNFYRVKVVD
jgi:ankyrin repeat protein